MEALLKEILAELKKINEYIDIQKAQHLNVSFGEIQSPSVEDIANKIKEILKEEIGQAANGC